MKHDLSHAPPSTIPYQLQRLGVVMRGDPDNSEETMGVLNPATARGPDGKLYLFARIVADGNYSRIGIGEVQFGVHGDPTGVNRMGYALEPSESYERNAYTAGCEDARITFVEPLGYYVMTYTAYGPLGPRIALAQSNDLIHWQRIGPAKFEFMPRYRVDFDLYDNKDAYLFPNVVNDPHGQPSLAMIHRPSNRQGRISYPVLPVGTSEARASMWISYCSIDAVLRNSSALLHWRDHCLLATPVYDWEALKIGGGTPPILTAQGWLTIFHGVSGEILEDVQRQTRVHYAAGAMVLDVADPRKVLFRSKTPILLPESQAEREGIVPNVVFPTGIDARIALDGTHLLDVYYGMADSCIGAARMVIPALMAKSQT